MKRLSYDDFDRMDSAADRRYADWMDSHPEDAPAPWYSQAYLDAAHAEAFLEDQERSRRAA